MSYCAYFPYEESDVSNVNEQRDTSTRVCAGSRHSLITPIIDTVVDKKQIWITGNRWNQLEPVRANCAITAIYEYAAHLHKTTKTASVSTFISWRCLINLRFLYVVLVVAVC